MRPGRDCIMKLKTLKFLGLAALLSLSVPTLAKADPEFVPENERPSLTISGEVATLTFVPGHVSPYVEVYGKGIVRIKPTGNTVNFNAQRWFNYKLADGNWALVEDGTNHEHWAPGIVVEASREFGGRASKGAALSAEASIAGK